MILAGGKEPNPASTHTQHLALVFLLLTLPLFLILCVEGRNARLALQYLT